MGGKTHNFHKNVFKHLTNFEISYYHNCIVFVLFSFNHPIPKITKGKVMKQNYTEK